MKDGNKMNALMKTYNVSLGDHAKIAGCSRIAVGYKNRHNSYKQDEIDRLLIFYKSKGADIISDEKQGWRVLFHSDSTLDKMQFARHMMLVKWTDVAKHYGISRATLDKRIRVLNFRFKDAEELAEVMGCKMKLLKNGKPVNTSEFKNFKLTDADQIFSSLGYETAFFDKDTGERLS